MPGKLYVSADGDKLLLDLDRFVDDRVYALLRQLSFKMIIAIEEAGKVGALQIILSLTTSKKYQTNSSLRLAR